MRPKPSAQIFPGERVVQDIRRATRKHYSAEDKIRIVLDGLRGEASSLASCPRHEACRRHCRVVPPRGHCPEPVLRLVEGVHGSRQAPPCRGHGENRTASAA